MLKLIQGILKPNHGNVRRKAKMGIVFQNPDHQILMPSCRSELLLNINPELSRKDIVSDNLMAFQEQSRFIKLPKEGYLELLGITPNTSQHAIINAINNPKYRFVCAAVSRRQGKTYIANIIGQLVTLVPNCNVLLMSPNYSLSQISFDLQRNLIKHFDLEVIRDNKFDDERGVFNKLQMFDKFTESNITNLYFDLSTSPIIISSIICPCLFIKDTNFERL